MGISAIQRNHILFLGQRHEADYHVAGIMEKKYIQIMVRKSIDRHPLRIPRWVVTKYAS